MVGLANSSTGGQFGFPFAVSKRANPTVAIIGTVTLNTTGGGSAGNMTIGGGGGSISGWAGGFSCSGSLGSAGNAAGIFGPNSGTNGFSVSAEL